jgi:outer membrane protein assembly factor BamB
VAYDLATGDEKWKWSESGTAYASPVAVELGDSKAVIAETSNSIVGLGVADGKELWSIDYPVEGRGYNASTPMLQGQKLIFSGSNRGTKAVELKKQGDSVTAEPLWSNEDGSVQFNTPVLKDGMIYGLTNRDVLFCINADSGETEWTAPYSEAVADAGDQQPAEQPQGRGRGRGGRGGGGYGSIVDAGSVLIALTPTADMVILQPSDEKLQSIASYKVSDSQTHAYPVASGNRIYIKDEDSIACWTVE